MKFFYLLLLAGATYFSTNAQVTIANLDLSVGDTLFLEQDTTTIISNIDFLATAGSGQIWDYTNLKSHGTDYVKIQNPSAGVWANEFPDADMMVYNDEDSNYIYLEKTATYLKIIGIVELSDGDTNLTNIKLPFVYFPSSLGTSNVQSTNIVAFNNYLGIDPDGAMGGHPEVDSLRVRLDQNIYTYIDAEGTLKLPNADFEVIRQVIKPIVITHAEMFTNGSWSYISPLIEGLIGRDSISYDTNAYQVRFWSDDPNAKFSIVGYDLDSTNAATDGTIDWIDMQPYDVNIAEKSELISSIYPNPATSNITLTLKERNNNSSYKIIAITGEIIASGILDNQINSIGIEFLTKGSYLLKITSNDKNEVLKLIKK